MESELKILRVVVNKSLFPPSHLPVFCGPVADEGAPGGELSPCGIIPELFATNIALIALHPQLLLLSLQLRDQVVPSAPEIFKSSSLSEKSSLQFSFFS